MEQKDDADKGDQEEKANKWKRYEKIENKASSNFLLSVKKHVTTKPEGKKIRHRLKVFFSTFRF